MWISDIETRNICPLSIHLVDTLIVRSDRHIICMANRARGGVADDDMSTISHTIRPTIPHKGVIKLFYGENPHIARIILLSTAPTYIV